MKFLLFLSLFAASSGFTPTAFAPRTSAASSTPKTSTALKAEEYGASSTSFYTTTEKQDTYDDLDSILESHCADKQVRACVRSIARKNV